MSTFRRNVGISSSSSHAPVSGRSSYHERCAPALLGGPLGGLLAQHLLGRGWLARQAKGRAVRVTSRGARGLAKHFSLRWQ